VSKLQLHVSGLETMSMCGIRFEKRYLLGEKTPPSVRMAIGTAVDQSVNKDLESKIRTGDLLPVDAVKDCARDALVEEWAKGVSTSQEDLSEGLDASRDSAIDTSVDLAGFHRSAVAPHLTPTHVQRPWVLDIDGLDLQLAGTIDIQEGRHSIRDTKTSAKSPVKDLADKSLQLTTYCLAVRQHDGTIPELVVLDYTVRTPKRGDLKYVPLVSKRTDADIPHLIERVVQAHRMIQAGLFMPAPISAWWCSRTFCDYHQKCKYAAHPVTVAVGGAE
jgi:hypothetical protein